MRAAAWRRSARSSSSQPLLTLGWSALLLGEHVDALTLLAAVAVLACVVLTQRSRVDDVAATGPET